MKTLSNTQVTEISGGIWPIILVAAALLSRCTATFESGDTSGCASTDGGCK